MDSAEPDTPREALQSVFHLRETYRDGERLLFYGEALVSREALIEEVWPAFREAGYEAHLATTRSGSEDVVVAEPVSNGPEGVPWKNLGLLVATVLSTLFVGADTWYYVRDPLGDPLSILVAWPFAAAVLGILGIHELGHYAMSRYHDVDATLPYFIPLPTIIGTMGAVIRMKGQIPDRKALFDIGVAGPIAGLVATVVVTAIGLSMPPIDVPAWVYASPGSVEVQFGKPLLFQAIAAAMGVEAAYRNPVTIGAWVGMFVTFLNLLPVGQLDGGHIVRALVGDRQRTVAALVPAVLFGLAGYLFYVEHAGNAVGIWVLWGLLSLGIAFAGPARPIQEEGLDAKRKVVGVLTLLLGLACFTPVPIQILA